jgi:hypothetical protein
MPEHSYHSGRLPKTNPFSAVREIQALGNVKIVTKITVLRQLPEQRFPEQCFP